MSYRCSCWSSRSGGRASPRRRRRRSSGSSSSASSSANKINACHGGRRLRCWDEVIRVCEAHHARRAEYSGVQTAGFSQHQHILTTQTDRRSSCTPHPQLRDRSEPNAEQPAHHFLLLFGRLDEAWVRPARAKVVVEQSGGVQREQDLSCGAGAMWGQRLRNSSAGLKRSGGC